MFLLPGGNEPLYRQLVMAVQEDIRRGIYQPGDRLPTVRAVAASLVVNPNTVARAYQELEKSGVIETVIGRGSFVLDTTQEVGRWKHTILEGMRKLYELGWTAGEVKHWCLEALQAMESEEN